MSLKTWLRKIIIWRKDPLLGVRWQCPICREWIPAGEMVMGYKITAHYAGGPSHGGVCCPQCAENYEKRNP